LISQQIFEKYVNIKFLENPSGGSQVVTCGQMDRQTDMMKPIITFSNCVNVPKKRCPFTCQAGTEGR